MHKTKLNYAPLSKDFLQLLIPLRFFSMYNT